MLSGGYSAVNMRLLVLNEANSVVAIRLVEWFLFRLNESDKGYG